MCCQGSGKHAAGIGGCGCNCGSLSRQFYTPKEIMENLKKYENQLKNELIGVQERITELQK